MHRAKVLSLYRSIIDAARRFPSIKRNELVEEIRIEFRANKTLTDQKELDLALEKAMRGLSQLQKYTALRPGAAEWVVDLEKDPLGTGPQRG